MEELVVSAHEFESFSKWYRYREPVVSGCVQGVSSTRNIHFFENRILASKKQRRESMLKEHQPKASLLEVCLVDYCGG